MSRKRGTRVSRREFLRATGSLAGTAVSLPYIFPSGTLAAPAGATANNRLTIAVIGVGGMGTVHLKNLLEFRKEGKVNIAAVCDADETRLAKAVETAGEGVTPYPYHL